MMANEMKSMKLDTTHDVSYYIMLMDRFINSDCLHRFSFQIGNGYDPLYNGIITQPYKR